MAQRRCETDGCRDRDAVLERGERGPVVVGRGVGEVAEQRRSTRSLPMRSRRAASANTTRQSSGAMPLRPSPVSSLRCTPTGRSADAAAAACCSWSKLEMPSSMPGAGGLGEGRAGGVQPREDRRDDAGPAQGERLADVGDAEPGRAALERRDGAAHGAVAVAVGLDDRDDLGVGEPAEVPHVRRLIAPTSIGRPRACDAGGQAAHAAARRRPRRRVGGLGDDVRDREPAVVRHRQVERRDPPLGDDGGASSRSA